jgi:hypothetical protein
MIDSDAHKQFNYEPPALVRVGSIVEIAAELEKLGARVAPSVLVPGDPVDWSSGRIS